MTTTTTHPTDTSTGTSIEQDQLRCPGCRDTVCCEPPTSHPETSDGSELGFCHRDGSVLCGQLAAGPVVEPVEERDC
jgi:hypothetical protein